VTVTAETPRALLEQFRELAEEFRRAARDGDLERMDDLLGRRRTLADGLARAKAPRGAAERAERAELVEAILALDREAEAALRAHQAEIGDALVELSGGRRGLVGYGAGAGSGGKWIDERG
jgi:hypothetical protein